MGYQKGFYLNNRMLAWMKPIMASSHVRDITVMLWCVHHAMMCPRFAEEYETNAPAEPEPMPQLLPELDAAYINAAKAAEKWKK